MLFQATLLVDLVAMAITLWGAFYLLARGFRNWITLRAVVVLLALSMFFLGAYNNIFNQVEGTAAIRAVLLIIGLGAWYSLTNRLLSQQSQTRLRILSMIIYLLGVTAAVTLIVSPDAFVDELGNALYVAHMRFGFHYVLYGLFQVLVASGILYNLLAEDRIGFAMQGKFFLAASFFPALAVASGIIGLALVSDFPRIVQDIFIFGGLVLLGISVARHQTMMERRTTALDLPVSFLTAMILAGAYAYLAQRIGIRMGSMGMVVSFAVLTHSMVDLSREFLERLRIRRENEFRQHYFELENQSESGEPIDSRLQEGLDLLCQALESSAGFIAVQRGEVYSVVASRDSLPRGTELRAETVRCEDRLQPNNEQLPGISWIVPSYVGQAQVAVIGIGMSKAKLEYSSGDLDLLSEVAEHVGTLTSLGKQTPAHTGIPIQGIGDVQSGDSTMRSTMEKMISSISTNPDDEFVKYVEDALRHYADYMALGQSPLTEYLGIHGNSHVDCGKQLQKLLAESIDAFRPTGTRPPEPLPREWFSHVVLHDAYILGVPNREIMARLYISEGTFNRTRRNALRGLARSMAERTKGAIKN